MAKGRGKSTSSGGPHKKHGPKKHLFRWTGPMKQSFAQTGILSKYYNRESFELAVAAKGFKFNTGDLWIEFSKLPDLNAKKNWFKTIKK